MGGNAQSRASVDLAQGACSRHHALVEPFWQDESYDHWVRNRQQRDRMVRYIEDNPVSAGLVASAEQWGWSSAGGQWAPPAPPQKHSGTPDSSQEM